MERTRHGPLGAVRKLFVGPVDLVTIHHEGFGDPTDVPRGAHGGYSVWMGSTVATRLRSPYVSYATLGFNHRSWDVCWSGNRMHFDVTKDDIDRLHAEFLNAHALGWVTDAPLVRDHRSSPGSATVCSGDKSRAVWNDIVGACRFTVPAPVPVPPPAPIPELEDEEMAFILKSPNKPDAFLSGNKLVLLKDPETREALDGADVKSVTITNKDYARFLEAFDALR